MSGPDLIKLRGVHNQDLGTGRAQGGVFGFNFILVYTRDAKSLAHPCRGDKGLGGAGAVDQLDALGAGKHLGVMVIVPASKDDLD